MTFKEVLLIDSTTVCLFSDTLKGVGRNPKGIGKKKSNLQVHMLVDVIQSHEQFIKITVAIVHHKNFLGKKFISYILTVFELTGFLSPG